MWFGLLLKCSQSLTYKSKATELIPASCYHLNSTMNLKQETEIKIRKTMIIEELYYNSNLLPKEIHEDGNPCTEFDPHGI